MQPPILLGPADIELQSKNPRSGYRSLADATVVVGRTYTRTDFDPAEPCTSVGWNVLSGLPH
jgi:hypothetical protein